MKLSASMMPRALKCPASIIEPAIRYDDKSDAASLGTIVHDALAKYVDGNPEIVKLNFEARELFYAGVDEWNAMKEMFPNAEAERRFTSLRSGGIDNTTCDVVSYDKENRTLRIADWKTGNYTDVKAQLKTYAVAAAFEYEVDFVECHAVFLRERLHEVFKMDKRDLTDWWNTILDVQKSTDRYATGEHCKYCPRLTECPALSKSLALFDDTLPELSSTTIQKYRPVMIQMEKAIERFKKAQKVLVETEDLVDLGDGTALKQIHMSRRVISAKGREVLEEGDYYVKSEYSQIRIVKNKK